MRPPTTATGPREISAIEKAFEFDNEPQPGIWYSRFNVQEMTSDVVTPLTWSVSWWAIDQGAQRSLVDMGVKSETSGPFEETSPFFYGRPWWRHGDVAQLVGEAQIPGAVLRMEELYGLPVDDIPELADMKRALAPDAPRDMRSAPVMLQMLAAAAGHRAYDALGELEPIAVAERRRWLAGSPDQLSDAALAEACLAARELATEVYRRLFTVSYCATLSPMTVAFVLAELGEEDPETGAQALLAGAGGVVRSADVSERLWEVHEGRVTWDEFISEFGARGDLEIELASRPWRADAAAARRMLDAVAAAPRPPAEARAEATRRSQALLDGLRTRHAGTPQLVDLETVVELGRKFGPAREWSKHLAVEALDACRLLADEVARRTGLGDDVWYCTLEELVAALRSEADLPDPAVRGRRRAQREHCRSVVLPEAFEGYPRPVEARDEHAAELRGYGVYPGTVRAPARVLATLDDAASLAPGEVLVASVTDAAWTPLFTLAAAVVVDYGSRESHAAIVARELGIPTVVNVRRGTKAISTGDVLEVDGATGVVLITGDRHVALDAPVVIDLDTLAGEPLSAAAEELRHGLRLTGGLEADPVDDAVAELVGSGHARWQGSRLVLTGPGRQGDDEWARVAPGSDHETSVRRAYESFLPLNDEILRICSDWQLHPDGSANDHGDPEYDWSVIDRLSELDQKIGPILRRLGRDVARFGRHRPRLKAARDRVEDGEHQWLASPTCDSYHTVWMQLHEDLLGALGVTREEEAGALERA